MLNFIPLETLYDQIFTKYITKLGSIQDPWIKKLEK